MWPQQNAEALRSIMWSTKSDYQLHLEKGCCVVTSEASGIETFLLYATNKYVVQRSMGGARKELHQKCYDCIELMELDPKSSLMIRSIQQVLCIFIVFNTSTNKIQCSLMINCCALKNKQKVGLNKCYPYDLLELSYLKGRPD